MNTRANINPKKHSRIQLCFALLIVGALVVLPIITPLAQAQENCGFADVLTPFECIDLSNFDEGSVGEDERGITVDGWAQEQWQPNGIEWLASKTFGMLWWSSSADGVMRASGNMRVQKSVYLEPGRYRFLWRAAADKQWNGWTFENPLIVFKGQYGNTTWALTAVEVGQTFDNVTSGVFEIDDPGPVMLEIFNLQNSGTGGGEQNSASVYFDYIWLVRDSVVGTPTPYAGGPPTKTPLPGTATPVPGQATPIATPVGFYCVDVPTPTPGPPQYGTPVGTSTPGASPTPSLDGWSYLDTFSQALLDWTVFGNAVEMVNNINHTAGNSMDLARSARLGYNPTEPLTTTVDFDSALAFGAANNFSLPFYVDGWAQADSLPVGESAYIEIWARDAGDGLWYKIDEAQVSPRRWYSFHFTIDAPPGGTGTLDAFAFVARRTDDPGSGGIFLDDIYFYGKLSNARRCDGTYPNTTTILSSAVGRSDEVPGDEGGWTYNWPLGKPCPPDIKVPNNFWGPMLAQLTVFLDNIYAFSPYHEPSSLTEMVRNLIGSPIAVYFGVAATFFDLRISVMALGIVLTLTIGRVIRGVWIIIKESIPFL